jgi:hypothetical protein
MGFGKPPFYTIIREGASQSCKGLFETKEEAMQAAKEATRKHLTNDRYYVMKTIGFAEARVDFACESIEGEG